MSEGHTAGDATLSADRRGQAEVVGVVLILGLAVIGISAVVVLGADAIGGTKQASHLERAEQGMALFDSKVAVVGLGDATAQQVRLPEAGDGRYHVEPGEGSITIKHVNYSTDQDASPEVETIYSGTIGSVAYENGDTEIAYQGGGVWRTTDDGTVMVSPPEFHYRGATLTLPVLRVAGGGSASTNLRPAITPALRGEPVYPNPAAGGTADGEGSPYDETDTAYRNPIENGIVEVTVTSEHYRGWATYFRQRTEGVVTVDDAANTATVELVSLGDVGDFQMPQDGNALKVRGAATNHPVDTFRFTLVDDDGDNADFSNLKWSLWAEKGGAEFEIHLRGSGSMKCGSDSADLYVYYSPTGTTDYHGWEKENFAPVTCADVDGDGTDEKKLEIDLSSSVDMSYVDLKNEGHIEHFSLNNKEFISSTTWDDHAADDRDGDGTYPTFPADGPATVDYVTDHYFALLGPSFDLWVADFGGDSVNEDQSSGYMDIDGTGGKYITYLHVTHNEVDVRFD
ncbi:MAG: hypothetical protein ABEJ42_07225 [Halobacteriaceae archaeon]